MSGYTNEYCPNVVRVWDSWNPDMGMVIIFSVEAENAEHDVLEAWNSWYSEEAEGYTRGDWMRECLSKKYGEGNFEFFYHEDWK